MCVPLIDRWLKCMDDGNLIGTIFLDLEKAFDTVDYFILGIKLHYYKNLHAISSMV
jgi:hypothetical protein